MTRARAGALLASLLVLAAALAVAGLRPAAPATLEERTLAVAQTLRCPACQAESVADSTNPTAQGMRAVIRDRLAAGDSPEQVRGFLVERYGETVLLQPPLTGAGRVLWLVPLAVLAIGAGTAALLVTRRRPGRSGGTEPAADATAGPDTAATPQDGAGHDRTGGTGDTGASPPGPAGPRRGSVRDRSGTGVPAGAGSATASDRAPRGRAVPAGTGVALAAVAAVVVVAALTDTVGPRAPGAPATGGTSAAGGSAGSGNPAGPDPAGPDLAGGTGQPADAAGMDVATGRALERSGDLAAAATAYQGALDRRPDDLEAAFRLGFVLARLDRAAAAEPVLARVVAARPAHAESLLLLGTVQRRLGRAEAAATLERFLAVAPADHPAAPQVRRLLEEEP